MPIALAALAAGCASSGAPNGWLPEPGDVGADPYGGWITVELTARDADKMRGELIAVSADSMHVLTQGGLQSLACREVRSARLAFYAQQTGTTAGWTILGALSTASHGVGLLLSFPLWVITGTASSSMVASEPLVSADAGTWADLRPYARFPQGMPAGLDRSRLKPRHRTDEPSSESGAGATWTAGTMP